MSESSAPYLSIVIPAFNEQARLPDTLRRIREYVAGKAFRAEVVVVDDGSRDATAEVSEAEARRWPAVRVIRNPGNRGKGYSVRNGMLHARGQIVLFTDADLSAPIEEADRLLEAIEAGADVAMGSRALRRELIGVHQSRFRETAGQIFNLLVRILTGLRFHDTQCGFKAYRLQAARDIACRQRIEGWGFDVEHLYLARKLGYRAAEVAVRWDHSEGTKVSMMRDSVRMFTDLVRIRGLDLQGKYDKPCSALAAGEQRGDAGNTEAGSAAKPRVTSDE